MDPGEEQIVRFNIDSELLGYTDIETKEWIVEPGAYKIQLGSASDNTLSTELIILK